MINIERIMAYLREEKQTVEIDLKLDSVWAIIKKVLTGLKWDMEEIDDAKHHIKAKTESHFMSYSSILLIDAEPISENKTEVTVIAKTPGTTITTMFDFGRDGRRRIDLFLMVLMEQLK